MAIYLFWNTISVDFYSHSKIKFVDKYNSLIDISTELLNSVVSRTDLMISFIFQINACQTKRIKFST